jgi:hypothetical protein
MKGCRHGRMLAQRSKHRRSEAKREEGFGRRESERGEGSHLVPKHMCGLLYPTMQNHLLKSAIDLICPLLLHSSGCQNIRFCDGKTKVEFRRTHPTFVLNCRGGIVLTIFAMSIYF